MMMSADRQRHTLTLQSKWASCARATAWVLLRGCGGVSTGGRRGELIAVALSISHLFSARNDGDGEESGSRGKRYKEAPLGAI